MKCIFDNNIYNIHSIIIRCMLSDPLLILHRWRRAEIFRESKTNPTFCSWLTYIVQLKSLSRRRQTSSCHFNWGTCRRAQFVRTSQHIRVLLVMPDFNILNTYRLVGPILLNSSHNQNDTKNHNFRT